MERKYGDMCQHIIKTCGKLEIHNGKHICKIHGRRSPEIWCEGCVAMEIIRKVYEVGSINPFWIAKYEEYDQEAVRLIKNLKKVRA